MTQEVLNKLSKNARQRVEQMKWWYGEAEDGTWQKDEERARCVAYTWGLYDAGFLTETERRALGCYMLF